MSTRYCNDSSVLDDTL